MKSAIAFVVSILIFMHAGSPVFGAEPVTAQPSVLPAEATSRSIVVEQDVRRQVQAQRHPVRERRQRATRGLSWYNAWGAPYVNRYALPYINTYVPPRPANRVRAVLQNLEIGQYPGPLEGPPRPTLRSPQHLRPSPSSGAAVTSDDLSVPGDQSAYWYSKKPLQKPAPQSSKLPKDNSPGPQEF